jgi:outer membrane protein insertion porin family
VSVGAGFSSADSLVGFLELTENNFDLSRLFGDWPPKGAGQRLRVRAQLGTEVNDFQISFTEPWWLQRKLRLEVNIFSHTREEDEYDQDSIGASTLVTKSLSKYWRGTVGMRILHVDINDMDEDVSQKLMDEEGSEWANRFIFRLTRDSRNRYMFASRGSRLSLGAEIITQALGSYSNYGRFNIEATKFIPVLRDEYILKLGAEAAVAAKFTGDPIKIFDRYFAGGATSIRGFDRRDVSPVDENDDPIGGKSMLLANVELIKPIHDFMLLSVFCDTGNVWWGTWDIDPTDMNVSIGIGVQFKVLPVRIEYGYPIITQEDHLDDSNGTLHFNIGYSF